MTDFFTNIWEFFNSGIYQLLTDFTAWLTIKITIWWFKVQVTSVVFFWGVAEAILQQLNISGFINSTWGTLNSEVLAVLTYFRFPDALNLVINARLTRFVMDIWR